MIVGTLVAAIGAYWVGRGVVHEMAARTLAIFIIAAGFWATEALPLFATAFVVIGLEILFLASDGGLADILTRVLIWFDLPVRQSPDVQLMSAGTFLRPFSQDILSGTGKTTLSAAPERTLIGDDEHGWSDRGVFNFEGGCYAKVIRLSPEGEPEIYETTRRFGTILENVAMDTGTRRLDLDSDAFTENTRASYPLSHIPNATRQGMGGHPKTIIMLTADAFGVLPPIARLTPAQAMYHFLSGYTAKVAGTERGVTEPQATFSACFGAPSMALHPAVYAKLLGEKIAQQRVQVWLINTGWSGGPYGVGQRIKLAYTRAIVRAALQGQLTTVSTARDPIFGFAVPTQCPDVPPEVLTPRETWREPQAYDAQARQLAGMFVENFAQFAGDVSAEIRAAGPQHGSP